MICFMPVYLFIGRCKRRTIADGLYPACLWRWTSEKKFLIAPGSTGGNVTKVASVCELRWLAACPELLRPSAGGLLAGRLR
jgi:hypothetical protein